MAAEHILVADRNVKFLEKTQAILAEHGWGVIPIQRGNDVLVAHAKERPFGALLNIDLPEVAGADLCARLKRDDPALPVVLMSVGETPGLDVIARRCGADNFLVRPLKTGELLFCVRAMVRMHELLLQRAAATVGDGAGAQKLGVVSAEVFQRFMGLEVRRANRYGFPLAVLSIKIDTLPKTFNKAWVQALEEQLRPALSSAIRACVREIDLSTAADLSDTLVLMPHTDIAGAGIVAERIRHRISHQPYHFGRTKIQPTVSVGVAVTHGERTTAKDLLAMSHARRDRAATNGGNQVCSR